MSDIFALLGRRIKTERKARRLSQQELAEAAQIDTTHLSRVESGKTPPSIAAIKRIADALGLPMAALFKDIPPARARDHGYAAKIGHLVRDLPEKKRARVLRALKNLIED